MIFFFILLPPIFFQLFGDIFFYSQFFLPNFFTHTFLLPHLHFFLPPLFLPLLFSFFPTFGVFGHLVNFFIEVPFCYPGNQVLAIFSTPPPPSPSPIYQGEKRVNRILMTITMFLFMFQAYVVTDSSGQWTPKS